jgi:hypothetical protein
MAAEAILRQVAMSAQWAGDALVHMHHLLVLSKPFYQMKGRKNTKVNHLATQTLSTKSANGAWP